MEEIYGLNDSISFLCKTIEISTEINGQTMSIVEQEDC